MNKGVVDKVEVDSSVVRQGSLETESILFLFFFHIMALLKFPVIYICQFPGQSMVIRGRLL